MSNETKLAVTVLTTNQNNLMKSIENLDEGQKDIIKSIGELKDSMHQNSDEMKKHISEKYVSKDQFSPYQKWGAMIAWAIGIAIIWAVLSLVLK